MQRDARRSTNQSASQRWEARVRRDVVTDGGRSRRRSRSRAKSWMNVLLGVVAVGVSVQLIYGFASGIGTYAEVRRELADVESRLASVQQANDKLRQDVKYMKSPEFVEKEARRKLGLVRVGEVPVVLIRPDGRQNPAPDVARRPEPPRTDKDLY